MILKNGNVIKELKGHSGSQIYLMQNDNRLFVRKINNVDRNAERLTALYRIGYAVPALYSYTNNRIDMQYVHGLDVKNYLTHNTTSELIKFILATIKGFSSQYIDTDYTKGEFNQLRRYFYRKMYEMGANAKTMRNIVSYNKKNLRLDDGRVFSEKVDMFQHTHTYFIFVPAEKFHDIFNYKYIRSIYCHMELSIIITESQKRMILSESFTSDFQNLIKKNYDFVKKINLETQKIF